MKIIQKIKNQFHLLEAILANVYYGFPSRKLKVIGVTGTDGKTTTTHLIYHILNTAGKKVSLISTVYGKVGKEQFDTGLHTTTPGSFLIQRLLRKAVDEGDEYFVLETTSHALDQNRVVGVNYEVAVLTNITHEHLDYHETYDNYVKTKMKLLMLAKHAIVNRDDRSYEKIRNSKFEIRNLRTYGYKNEADFNKRFELNLTEFNRYNYLAAYAACRVLGLNDKTILAAMHNFKLPPGRMELVYNGQFKVIIDFAHTPNAIEQMLPEVRKNYLAKGGRLIHVFGAAGLRDRSKRPLMGEASSRFSDKIILTEEDYRTEDQQEILKEIASGIKRDKPYKMIVNREEAIKEAVSGARKNDVLVLSGKAHEKSLARGKEEYPWDEFAIVKKYVKLRSVS